MVTGKDQWKLADMELGSRLVLGTARYPSRQVLLDALAASGTQIVTVALRRVDLSAPRSESLLGHLPEGITVLEDYTFSSCSALAQVTIPEGVTEIGRGAFSGP